MKKTKRIITFLLAVLMLFSFTACKQSKKSTLPPADFEIGDTGGLEVPFGNGETVKIVISDEVGDSTNYIFEKLGSVVGLTVEPVLIPSASYNQKLQTILASGDLPELLSAGSLAKSNEYAEQGAFASVNDYLDKMPNFKRIFKDNSENDWVFKSLAATDGKLYVLPTYNINRLVNHGMLYRKDIFDKHGIEMWNSPESFYQVLKKLKQLYPNSYPLTSKTGSKIIQNYAVAWGINAYGMYYDEEAKVWKYADTDPKMRELLDYFKKLYSEGLLDPEFLTNTQAAWTTRMSSGKSFITYDWIGRLDQFTDQSDIPGYELRYGNPVGPKQTLVTLEQISRGGMVIAKNDKTELSMQLADFLYSDAGAELMTCGVRGETFEIDPATGMAKYLDPELAAKPKVDIMDLRSKYGMWMSGSYRTVDHRSCYFQFTEKEQEAQDWVEKCAGLEPADPVVTFVGDDMTRQNDLVNVLTKDFEVVMYNYIIGKNSTDADWNKWLQSAKQKGEGELVKLFNDRHKELGL